MKKELVKRNYLIYFLFIFSIIVISFSAIFFTNGKTGNFNTSSASKFASEWYTNTIKQSESWENDVVRLNEIVKNNVDNETYKQYEDEEAEGFLAIKTIDNFTSDDAEKIFIEFSKDMLVKEYDFKKLTFNERIIFLLLESITNSVYSEISTAFTVIVPEDKIILNDENKTGTVLLSDIKFEVNGELVEDIIYDDESVLQFSYVDNQWKYDAEKGYHDRRILLDEFLD